MSLGKKMAEAAADCRNIAKDGYNNFQKYKYTTASAILAKVNEALTSRGLYVSTRMELVEFREVPTAKGSVEKFAAVKAMITIKDSDDPQESILIEGLGSGQDIGDKAVMKANTAALKYAYIGGLNIGMGDDPEADESAPVQAQNSKPFQQTGPAQAERQKTTTQPAQAEYTDECESCGRKITAKMARFAMNRYGQKLCWQCQQEETPF